MVGTLSKGIMDYTTCLTIQRAMQRDFVLVVLLRQAQYLLGRLPSSSHFINNLQPEPKTLANRSHIIIPLGILNQRMDDEVSHHKENES